MRKSLNRVIGLSAQGLFERAYLELLSESKIRTLINRYYRDFFYSSRTDVLISNEIDCCFHYLRKYGFFQIWTKEFIGAFILYLKKTLSNPNALILDAGAGNGLLTIWLKKYGFNLIAIDARDAEWEFTQSGKIPDWVLRMDVTDALKKFQPELVIASWMPPLSPSKQECEWTQFFRSCPSVKEYILIGEESVTGQMPECGHFLSWKGLEEWPRKDLTELNILSLSYLDFLKNGQKGRKSVVCSFKKVR